MPGNKRERKVAKGKLAAFFMHIILYHFVHVLSHCGYGNWAWLCATIVMQELYIIYMGRNGGKVMLDVYVIMKPTSGQCNMKCEYHFICRGGCCRNREQFGEVYGRNIFCIGYRKFFEHSLVRMKRIAEWVKITRGDYLWNY